MRYRWHELKKLFIGECGRIVQLRCAFERYADKVRLIPYENRCKDKIYAKLKKTQKLVKRKIFRTILQFNSEFRRMKHFCRLLGVHLDTYNKRKWLYKWNSQSIKTLDQLKRH